MRKPLVSVITIADRPDRLPLLAWSLVAQTLPAWELVVLDQRPIPTPASEGMPDDDRIVYFNVPRRGDWGQTEKYAAACAAEAPYVMFPNDDAYYVPTALELMVGPLEVAPGSGLVLCGWLFNEHGYAPMPPAASRCNVDVGGFLARRAWVVEDGWVDRGQTGDGALVERLHARGGAVACHGILYVKN